MDCIPITINNKIGKSNYREIAYKTTAILLKIKLDKRCTALYRAKI